jgi:hypothetical protein
MSVKADARASEPQAPRRRTDGWTVLTILTTA